MKVSVSSYSYNNLYGNSFTLYDAINNAAEQSIEGFELLNEYFPENRAEALSEAKKLKKACADLQIEIPAVVTGANFLWASPDEMNREIERIKAVVEITSGIEVPFLRHDVANGFSKSYTGVRSFEAVLPLLAEACLEITEYAEKLGVVTITENHGFFVQDSERLCALVSKVNHPNYGILCDMGNFVCADEDPVCAVSRVAPLTRHAHAKDMHLKSGQEPNPGEGWFSSRGGNFIRGAVIGHGNVPVTSCLRSLYKSGYNGFVSIEFEGLEDPITGISIGAENLRRYISEAEKN